MPRSAPLYPSSVVWRPSSESGRACRWERKHRVQRVGIARSAQFARNIRMAQQARHPGERLEVIGTGSFRREQQENEVDGLTIERLEVNGPREAGK